MLNKTGVDFRKYFLMQFTKEVMRATDSYKETLIKQQVKQQIHKTEKRPPIQIYKTPPRMPIKRMVRNIIRQRIHRDTRRVAEMQKERPFENFFNKSEMSSPAVLKMPNLALPKTVQYIHPVMGQRRVELGKLDPLIKDPLVRTIECNGPDQKIVVTGMMGRKNTIISLTKEDIDSIIDAFSKVSRIPAQEGFYKVAVGRLVLSAIVSKIASSKFIITKMRELPAPMGEFR